MPIEREGIDTLSCGVRSASIIHVKLVVSGVCEQISTGLSVEMLTSIAENMRAQFNIVSRIKCVQSRVIVSKRRFV